MNDASPIIRATDTGPHLDSFCLLPHKLFAMAYCSVPFREGVGLPLRASQLLNGGPGVIFITRQSDFSRFDCTCQFSPL